MIFSRRHNFLYIAIPKTGSTSFQTALIPFSNIALVRGEHDAGKCHAHLNAKNFSDSFPTELTGRPHTFSFMRNPYSWAISVYNYYSRKELNNPEHLEHYRSTKNLSFDDFLSLGKDKRPFLSQSSFLYKSDGGLLDSIFKLEDIQNHTHELSKILPSELNIESIFHIKRNVSQKRLSEAALTKHQRARIEEIYADDFELYETLPIKSQNIDSNENNENLSQAIKAEAEFTTWTENSAKGLFAEHHLSLALYYRREKEFERALHCIEKSRLANPNIAGIMGIETSLYRQLKDHRQWEQHAKRCAMQKTFDKNVNYEGALWLYEASQYQEAYNLIHGMLEFTDGTPKDFILLASCMPHLSYENKKKASALLNQAKANLNNNKKFLDSLNKIAF